LFLAEFAGDKPWAHLDIAGPAFNEKETPASVHGATGFGVGLILQFLLDL
jgi:leucyl aminopeptidase